jgi:hypothetical protein
MGAASTGVRERGNQAPLSGRILLPLRLNAAGQSVSVATFVRRPAVGGGSCSDRPGIGCLHLNTHNPLWRVLLPEGVTMKKSRGGRMTAAKKRAAKRKGGKGPVSKRKAGLNIMKT